MIVYAASIVFLWRNENNQFCSLDYPVHSTSNCYSSLEGFLNFCVLSATQHECAAKASNLSINAMSSQIEPDGTLTPISKQALHIK